MAFSLVGLVGMVFAPLTVLQPILAITVFSLIFSFLVFALNKIFINRKAIAEIKAKLQEIRENLEKAQKDNDKATAQKHLQAMMEENSKFMKHSFKATIIPLILAMLILPWISSVYGSVAVARLPFSLPFIGSGLTGLYWYILISLAIGWVINNALGGKL